MRNEAQYCTSIVKSLNAAGDLGWKIPDPHGDFVSSLRVFDIMGRKDNKPLYIEAKFNKDPSAFNFKRIEPHQSYYLDEFAKIPDAVCYVALGVQWKRGETRSYIFEWRDISQLYHKGFSIHKKELEKLPFNLIKKEVFSFDNIITKDVLISIYGESIYDESDVSMSEVQENDQ
jgi:hypothetical protein